MSRKILLIISFLISCITYATAQNDYYYNNGQKIPLTLNEEKVVVSIPKERIETDERIRADVQVLGTIRDSSFDIIVITLSDYETLTSREYWNEDAKSVIITSSYFTEDNFEVYSTPYLNVELKEEQDVDLLASYADTYKLKIVSNMPLMPLWYILALTPESEKSPLVCANELYESGKFAVSVPDFSSSSSIVLSARGVTTTAIESFKLFDLQGRPVQGSPKHGVYIQNGKKVMK